MEDNKFYTKIKNTFRAIITDTKSVIEEEKKDLEKREEHC
jgi:hypothetical protein